MKKKLFLLFFLILSVSSCFAQHCQPSDDQQQEQVHGRFAHGYWDYPEQVENYKDYFAFLLRSFPFPEVKSGWINPFKTNMAQEGDIQALNAQCVGLLKVFLMGLSHGASTIASYLGTHEHDHVKAAVLESPFDTIESVVDSLVCKRMRLGWVPGLRWLVKFCLPYFFWKYRRDGIKPIDVVHNIRTDLPMLIVCSRQDTLVPLSSSTKLYEELRKTGHNHTHLLVLDHGKHSKLVFDKDAEQYKNVLHAFCRQYDLPHDVKLADLGKADLDQCQPEVGTHL